MDRERDRGGTEPLAALVSVAAICVAISVYAGFASVVVWESSEGETDRATLDSVWNSLSDDGIVDAADDTPLEAQLEPQTLPRGHRVAVNVTIVGDDGRLVTVASGLFGTDARSETGNPPPGAAVSERPVPVRVDDGDVRPGRLTVVVWDG